MSFLPALFSLAMLRRLLVVVAQAAAAAAGCWPAFLTTHRAHTPLILYYLFVCFIYLFVFSLLVVIILHQCSLVLIMLYVFGYPIFIYFCLRLPFVPFQVFFSSISFFII